MCLYLSLNERAVEHAGMNATNRLRLKANNSADIYAGAIGLQYCKKRLFQMKDGQSNFFRSEFRITRCTRERNDITDIRHTCHEQEQTLKSKPES